MTRCEVIVSIIQGFCPRPLLLVNAYLLYSKKVCEVKIRDISERCEPWITSVNFHVVKLSCITVDNRVNFSSVNLDEIAVVSLSDVSLVDFNVVLVVQPDTFCFLENISSVTVHCTCAKWNKFDDGLTRTTGVLSQYFVFSSPIVKWIMEIQSDENVVVLQWKDTDHSVDILGIVATKLVRTIAVSKWEIYTVSDLLTKIFNTIVCLRAYVIIIYYVIKFT